VADAFASNWIAPLGPHVEAFERELAATLGPGWHAAALSSGTAAIHLALEVLGVGRGDEVLCPILTFVATANPIRQLGATPVFLDSERRTWNLDPALLAEELADRRRAGRPMPKAAVVVDLYGQCADWQPILAACAEHGVPVIEDAAEALGATWQDRPAGSFGALSTFSFNGNKIITTSGGGMLCSRDEAVVARARFLATQARDPAPHYQHSVAGYNYRLSNLLAAVGRAQLAVLADRVDRRRAVFARYRELLGDLPGLAFMPEPPEARSTRWLTVLTIDPALFGADREAVRRALEAEDVEARPVWKPMHLQPLYREAPMRGGEVAAGLFERGLCLPSGSSLSDEDVERVAGVVRRCAGSSGVGATGRRPPRP
ncbi:MAG TPA: DegT/DnrJ/EryC1/StrS family aminotransferase, partial [Thermoanaerobaculia bacterium]